MPSGHSEGRVASAADEIVIDAHVVDALDLSLGDTVTLCRKFACRVLDRWDWVSPLHVFMAPEGSIFPPEPGQYVVGYVSDSGMARLTNSTIGNSNTILLDVEGIHHSISLTQKNMKEMKLIGEESCFQALENAELDGRIRDRGRMSQLKSCGKTLRVLSGQRPFAVMIAAIASITIVLSLQRLVQSQAKEIAALRTLGVNRSH